MGDDIATVKANSIKWFNTAVRGVQGGYVVTGQVQYQDRDTRGIVMTENAEGVAANAADACTMVANYMNTGTFDGVPAAQGNMFAPASI